MVANQTGVTPLSIEVIASVAPYERDEGSF